MVISMERENVTEIGVYECFTDVNSLPPEKPFVNAISELTLWLKNTLISIKMKIILPQCKIDKKIISSDNVLWLIRQQAIIWTNDDLYQWYPLVLSVEKS